MNGAFIAVLVKSGLMVKSGNAQIAERVIAELEELVAIVRG